MRRRMWAFGYVCNTLTLCLCVYTNTCYLYLVPRYEPLSFFFSESKIFFYLYFNFYPRNFRTLLTLCPSPFKRQNMSVLECARTAWEKVVGSADGGLDAALFLDAAQAVANVLDLLTGMGMVKSDMQVRHLPASAAVLTNSCPAPRLLP